MRKYFWAFGLVLFFLLMFKSYTLAVTTAEADETKVQHLAKQLQNPVASLISVPFQNNWYSGLGAAGNGTEYLLRFQPVIPALINNDWLLVTRPIFSYISQQNVVGTTSQTGLGDTQIEIFFSPARASGDGVTWGLGPILQIPTAAEALLGAEKWGIGPAACLHKQNGPWTTVALLNHVWSFTGNNNRSDICATFLEPIFAHSSKKGTTFVLMSESTYDWISNRWAIPLEAGVSQVLPLFGHYWSFSATGIYNLDYPGNINKWAARFTVTLILPEHK
ncbi:MAG: transporter [Candidatus Margulisbacteria bacterium]|nr:transporter [Candidatus Margulisiibacteriota bacterium]